MKLILVLFAILGCQEENAIDVPHFQLKFSGEDFQVHDNQNITLGIVDRSDLRIVQSATQKIENGQFSFEMSSLLAQDQDYFVDYFVDMNGNNECDAPIVDHSWRMELDQVEDDVDFTVNHSYGFSEVCDSFTPQASTATTKPVLLSGTISLSSTVSDIEGVESGAKLVSANIFVEGYPEYEAKTDENGVFQFEVPVELNADSLAIVMWYTNGEKTSGIQEWDNDSEKVGLRKVIPAQSTDLGEVDLLYTTKVGFKVKDSISQEYLSTCWVHIPKYQFQIFVRKNTEHLYWVDYLPEGSYEVSIQCPGYQSVNKQVEVQAAGSKNAVLQLDDIAVIAN